MRQYSKRHTSPKPHIYKICGRWVWMQAGCYKLITKKTEIQLFVDKLNDAKF